MGESTTKIEEGIREKYDPSSKKNNTTYQSYKKGPTTQEQVKFIEMCTALSDHTCDCSGDRQSEKYTKTTKKIAEYIGQDYTVVLYIRKAFETLTPTDIDAPDDPNDAASKLDMSMW